MTDASFLNDATPRVRKVLAVFLAGMIPALLLYVFLAFGGTLAALTIAVVLVAALLIALRWPEAGLMVMGALVVAEVSQNLSAHFGLPSTSQLIVPALAVLFALRYLLQGEKPFVSGTAWLAILGYLALMALSVLHARYWGLALNTTYSAAKDFAIVLLTLAFIRKPAAMRVYLNAVLFTASVICVLGFYRYLTGSSNNFGGFVAIDYVERRFAGPLTDPNFFAMNLAFLVPVAVGRILHGPGTSARLFGALTGAVLFAGLLLTASRGGLLAVLAALAVFVIFMERRHQVAALILGCGVALIVSIVLSDQLADRFEFLFAPESVAPQADISVEGRLANWAVARQLFYDHPLLGVGIGNFNAYFQDTALQLGLIFRGEGRSAHGLYHEAAAEMGLLGLVGLLSILGLALIRPFQAARAMMASGHADVAHDCRALAIGLLAMFLARVFLHDDYPILMWTAIGIGLGLPKICAQLQRPSTDL